MLDIKRIKEDPEKVKAGLRAKEVNCDQEVDRILALDKERRDIIHDMEQKKAEQNKVSKTIPQLKKAGEDTAPVFQKMSELKGQIAAQEETLRGVEAEYRTLMLSLPNLPDDDLKPGGRRTTSLCATSGSLTSLTLRPSIMWTCAPTWVSSTTPGGEAGRLRLLDVHRPGRPAGVGPAELLHRQPPGRRV